MQKSLSTLKQHHKNAEREAFFAQILDIAPGLESYVDNRLHMAQRNGLIPAGFYTAQDIIDDVLLTIYERFGEMPEDESGLRVRLFQLANEKLEAIISEESWHHDAVRLESVLSDELRQMSEIPQMTADVDGDIVLIEELDDAEIEPREPRILLLEDSFEDEIIGQTGLSAELIRGDGEMRQLLARIYAELPAQSRILFDLWTRGKLTVEEIARVRAINIEQVKDILDQIQARFSGVIK